MKNTILLGPFTQIVPLSGLPLKGAIADNDLQLISDGGILIEDGHITALGPYSLIMQHPRAKNAQIVELTQNHCCLPGFIDAHSHICYGGTRAKDYALRNSGKTYLEIAKAGGGIWDTVTQTRKASMEVLVKGIVKRAKRHLKNGTTTLEVKSGYGLSPQEELKMLRAIKKAQQELDIELIATCLAAHMVPKDFDGGPQAYLAHIAEVLFPIIKKEGLTGRIDAFIEESAFSAKNIAPYFTTAKNMGFDICVHADQFTTGGSQVAVEFDAISADHLEASTDKEIALLAKSDVIATALPGASLGLGCGFTPARKILDAGGTLAIASDHNPGSAPMGDLLTQAAILGAFEKLTNAEVLAGITSRAAAALNLKDRGQLVAGQIADLCVFHTNDYSEILYNQGNLKPCQVYKKGIKVFDKHND